MYLNKVDGPAYCQGKMKVKKTPPPCVNSHTILRIVLYVGRNTDVTIQNTDIMIQNVDITVPNMGVAIQNIDV